MKKVFNVFVLVVAFCGAVEFLNAQAKPLGKVLIKDLDKKIKEVEKKFKLTSRHDDMEGIITFRHKRTLGSGNTCIYPYFNITEQGELEASGFIMSYVSYDKKLEINKYLFNIDGEKYYFEPAEDEVKFRSRVVKKDDKIKNKTYEELDVKLKDKPELYRAVKAILTAERVKLRYYGLTSHHDKTINKGQIERIVDVIEAYRYLGGTF